MINKPLVMGIVGGILVVTAGGFSAAEVLAKDINVTVDGAAHQVRSYEPTVEKVLINQGIRVGEHDSVVPALNATVTNGSQIAVRYGRQLTVTVDGREKTIWTTARTVEEALADLAVSHPNVHLSVSRSTKIGREGLRFSLDIPRKVTITTKAGSKDVEAIGSVSDALTAAGVEFKTDDKVFPTFTTPVADGMKITVVSVEKKKITKDVPVAFQTSTENDPNLALGVEKVRQAGVEGVSTQQVLQVFEDDKLVAETVESEATSKDPVNAVVVVGTKKADPAPAREVAQGAAAPAPSYSGSHADWMAAAGIAPGDFGYAEKLIARESGWNPNARNSGSGACGLVQALPCSKLGPNWNDPVVALRWGDGYVKSRYGGWAQAWGHFQSRGWY